MPVALQVHQLMTWKSVLEALGDKWPRGWQKFDFKAYSELGRTHILRHAGEPADGESHCNPIILPFLAKT